MIADIVVVKKCCGTETFFSTTVHAFMPQFRNSEHYYGKRLNADGQRMPLHGQICKRAASRRPPAVSGKRTIAFSNL
jgi:hypothetical protein